MVIAVYGKTLGVEFLQELQTLLNRLEKNHVEVVMFAPFHDFLKNELLFDPSVKAVFRTAGEVKYLADFMVSLGGDGTFLESVSYIEESCIPVLGINFGRLGFLANISTGEIGIAIDLLLKGRYSVEPRSMLSVSSGDGLFSTFPHGLNDFTLQKADTSMLSVNTYIDNEYLCTYWADGLIVSTPTGSTAYSLSVGGPILSPRLSAFVLSPIAPHHLTVRPFVIPDSSTIRLETNGRAGEVMVSLDSRSVISKIPLVVEIRKAPFHVGLVNLEGTNFHKTLRNKLLWGVDKRN